MRVFLIVLALSFACAAIALAEDANSCNSSVSQPAEPSTATPAPSGTGVGTGICPPPAGAGPAATVTSADEMLDSCISSSYNLSRQQIRDLRSQGLSNSDIAMAGAIAAKSGCPVSQIVSEYKTDQNWTSVANRHNLSMSDLTSMPVAANPDVEQFNKNFISQYYSVSSADIDQLRKQGYSWGEINMMANASMKTNQPIQQIAMDRSQGMTWTQIANKYNVALTDVCTPATIRSVTTVRPYGAGPAPVIGVPPVMYDNVGNVMLTEDQATRFYRMGYDWTDVAIAANISRETGVPIRQVLSEIRPGGKTWPAVASDYGVVPSTAFNISGYPFPHVSIYSQSMQEANMRQIEQYQTGATTVVPQPTGTPPTMPSGGTQPVPPSSPLSTETGTSGY